MRIRRILVLLTVVASLVSIPAVADAHAGAIRVTGHGSFLYSGSIPMQFGFSAVLHESGSADGWFHHRYTAGGLSYEFWGEVTCVTFDAANGRAWVGGTLTKVRSNDPNVGVAPGDDAWFRVLDSPAGDRSTAMGFVGVFASSAAYCAQQPWPDGNARTWPVTKGQVKVHTGQPEED